MRADTSRGTFKDVLHQSKSPMSALAYRLRRLIAELYPDVVEVPRPAEHHASYGIGRERESEIFGYICPMSKYVRLGFYYAAGLPDPHRLLEGDGKRLRHIKVYSLREAARPELRRLLQAAIRERKKAHGLK